jgi:hypothetical protein
MRQNTIAAAGVSTSRRASAAWWARATTGDVAHERSLPRSAASMPICHTARAVAAGDAVDARRQRGREQTVCRSTGVAWMIASMSLAKPIEHLVGLVEHHHLDPAERQRATPDVVARPTGRGDDDMGAARQRVELRPDGLPAVDRHDAGTELAAVLGDRIRNLHCQLARRNQDQGHRGRPPAAANALENRQQRPSCRCRWRPGQQIQPATATEPTAWIGVGSLAPSGDTPSNRAVERSKPSVASEMVCHRMGEGSESGTCRESTVPAACADAPEGRDWGPRRTPMTTKRS